MEETWMVLLEAAGHESGPPVDLRRLGELMAAMHCDQIIGLHDPHRYAIQFHITSTSPAEALFAATSRWRDGVNQQGFDHWALQRSEVLSVQEFDREWATLAAQDVGPAGGEAEDLLRSVFFDGLTGFPTLSLFRDRAHAVIAACALSGHHLALLVVDLDRFAAINDMFGYSVGDRVLVEVAGRLTRWAESTWGAARRINDEFVLLVDDEAGSAAQTVSDLVAAMGAPMKVAGHTMALTASVGAVAVDPTVELDEQLDRARVAAALAQEAGGNGYRWWEPGLPVAGAGIAPPTPLSVNRLAYILLVQQASLAANECSSLEEASALVLQKVLAHTGWRAGRLAITGQPSPGPSAVWRVSGPDPLDEVRAQTDGYQSAEHSVPVATAARTGRPAWRALARGTGRDAAIDAGLAAVGAFPILAGAEVVGVLEFFSPSAAEPDSSLLDVLAAVASQLGRIAERGRAAASIAQAEERYRRLAESWPSPIGPTDEDGGWNQLAAALHSAVTPLEVAGALATTAARAAGASFSNMAFLHRDTNIVQVVHHPRLDAAMALRWTEFSLDEPTPLCEAITSGAEVLLPSLEAIGDRYPNLVADTVSASLCASASIPLRRGDGTTLGAMGFAWDQPQRFLPGDLRRLETIADLATGALERALLVAARAESAR